MPNIKEKNYRAKSQLLEKLNFVKLKKNGLNLHVNQKSMRDDLKKNNSEISLSSNNIENHKQKLHTTLLQYDDNK